MQSSEHPMTRDSNADLQVQKHRLEWDPQQPLPGLTDQLPQGLDKKLLIVQCGQGGDQLVSLDRESVVTVGRNPDCCVTVPDPSCSRLHCKLFELEGEWLVTHLSRTNATWLNGKSIAAAYLRDGDVIQVGSSRLTFRIFADDADRPSGDFAA